MSYSKIFQCLFDQPEVGVRPLPYTIFRAFDSKDVTQKPTSTPHIHDFCVLWDEDHDERVIHVAESLFSAGLLPGVQFLRESKGTLHIILAAKTFFEVKEPQKVYSDHMHQVIPLLDDFWHPEVGMYDRSDLGQFNNPHQCEFNGLLGSNPSLTLCKLWNIDHQWDLGTKPMHSPKKLAMQKHSLKS